jgi:hypothetical protein
LLNSTNITERLREVEANHNALNVKHDALEADYQLLTANAARHIRLSNAYELIQAWSMMEMENFRDCNRSGLIIITDVNIQTWV